MAEKAIVAKIAKVLVGAGAYVQKNHGGAFSGVGRPDLEGCLEGRFFGIEVKVPERRGRITPLQNYTLAAIRGAGGYAGVMTTVEEAQEFVLGFPFRCRHCLGALEIVSSLDDVVRCRTCHHVA
jgi:hypothetical protein